MPALPPEAFLYPEGLCNSRAAPDETSLHPSQTFFPDEMKRDTAVPMGQP